MQKTSAILIFMMLTPLPIPAFAYNGASGQAAEFQRSWNLESEGTSDSNSYSSGEKKIFFLASVKNAFIFQAKSVG